MYLLYLRKVLGLEWKSPYFQVVSARLSQWPFDLGNSPAVAVGTYITALVAIRRLLMVTPGHQCHFRYIDKAAADAKGFLQRIQPPTTPEMAADRLKRMETLDSVPNSAGFHQANRPAIYTRRLGTDRTYFNVTAETSLASRSRLGSDLQQTPQPRKHSESMEDSFTWSYEPPMQSRLELVDSHLPPPPSRSCPLWVKLLLIALMTLIVCAISTAVALGVVTTLGYGRRFGVESSRTPQLLNSTPTTSPTSTRQSFIRLQ